MRFLHLADAHLDSPFLGLSFLPSDQFKTLKDKIKASFVRAIDLAVENHVDLVLIAGDTFDSNRPSPNSQVFFASQVKRLTDAKIQVVMIFGNHDYMSEQALFVSKSPYFKLLGSNQKVESAHFETREHFPYLVNGFSYGENHITQDMVPQFPSKSSCYTFGLMHAGVKASTVHQNVYAPFTVSEVKALNYDYFALGHIHTRQNLSEQPWLVYPGNLLGRHINEQGPKGVILGTIAEQTHHTTITFSETSPLIWQEICMSITQTVTKTTLQEKILTAIQPKLVQQTLIRLRLKGAQFLTQEETDLLMDKNFQQQLAKQLPFESLVVDIHLLLTEPLVLTAASQKAFEQAAKEVFTPATLMKLGTDLANKSSWTRDLLMSPETLKQVEELTRFKVAQKLKGLSQ